MIFRISAAKELALFTLVKRAQTTLAVPILSSRLTAVLHRDTRNTQAPLAKIDTRSKITRFILVSSLWYLVSSLCGCDRANHLNKSSRVMMGTFVEVISSEARAHNIAFDEIKRIEGLLSKYIPDSDISKLNKAGKAKVSSETFYIVKKAIEFYKLTDGAFDVTVGPLVDLWGFQDKKFHLPKDEEIKDALRLIGSDKIILHEQDNMIEFKLSGMQIDLGAIAKGFAVDCAIKKLKNSGIKNCLINAGGQIFCLGSSDSGPWRVAIRNPVEKDKVVEYLELENKAVSTSGSYEQYFIQSGKRYSHIFDPKTGYPASSDILSVTVIAADGATADALSTGIFVLGSVKKAEEFARKIAGVEVKIVTN